MAEAALLAAVNHGTPPEYPFYEAGAPRMNKIIRLVVAGIAGGAACVAMATHTAVIPASAQQHSAAAMKYRNGTYYFISKDPTCSNAAADDPDNYCGTVEVIQIKGSRVRVACYGPQWPNCMGTNGWARLVKGRIIGTSDNGMYQWKINEPVFPPKTGDQAMIRVSHSRASAEYPELDAQLRFSPHTNLPFG